MPLHGYINNRQNLFHENVLIELRPHCMERESEYEKHSYRFAALCRNKVSMQNDDRSSTGDVDFEICKNRGIQPSWEQHSSI